MSAIFLSADTAKSMNAEECYQKLQTTSNGLTSQEAADRLKAFGLNILLEKERSAFIRFLLYFWGPIPWMIELAAILSIILRHWPDLAIILTLLLVTGLVGFFQERQAKRAIEALRKQLISKDVVKRDGKWIETKSSQITFGDLVRFQQGDIIPADVKLLTGNGLSVNQSTLTGESLPISKKVGDIAYSGSIIVEGEMEALVIATAENTFFGRTAKLVEKMVPFSHFQQAILKIGRYLIYISLGLACLIAIVQFSRGNSFLELAQFVLVLIVASIPVAMPAVLSVTMAIGASRLFKMNAIVTKLESIEEMASMAVLFCEKTGTLDQNNLQNVSPNPLSIFGVRIKILTEDSLATAKELSHQLQIGERICKAQELQGKNIEDYDGIAEVTPENKLDIIQSLQKDNYIIGMTGIAAADSPALKQADVGIAVSGATDAARSAASLVLTQPGLSVIIQAIEEARHIFERMNSYAIYRITETIRIMLFMVLCIWIYNFYPINTLMIILLALLNDIPIMTIAYDHTVLQTSPVRWKMKRILTLAAVLGTIGVCSTFLLIIIAKEYLNLSLGALQSLIFLKLSVAGHQTLFVVRAKHAFFSKPYPSPILLTAILSTQIVAALLVGFGILVTQIPWSYVFYLWLYTLVWMFFEDWVKNFLYRYLGRE